jgi:hypothetical protein
MSTVMLRARGVKFDVDLFLKGHPKIQPDAVWRQGETTRRHVFKDNGFQVLVAEAQDSDDIVELMGRFFDKADRLLGELAESGAATTIDFSLHVGSSTRFVNSIRFRPSLLARAAQAGVDLKVTGYPTRG